MTDLERAVQAIERGLLTAIHIKGRPQGRIPGGTAGSHTKSLPGS